MTDDTITILCYDRHGRLVDVIENVDLGDRHEAQRAGRESLHSAVLWGHVAAKAAEREYPPG